MLIHKPLNITLNICKRAFSSTSPKNGDSSIVIKKLTGVMSIGINRPETCNALDYETANQLSDAISQFEEDDSSLVGVIYGVAGNFCSGFDLKEMSKDPNIAEKMTGLRLTDRYVSKPMVAAISGYAVGAGMDLALWCDVRVMEETAVMGCLQRRFGIPQSQSALDRMKHMVGLSRSMDWILTGRAVKAQEAHACGLLSRLVSCGTAIGQGFSLATSIAKFPQSSVNADRAALYIACLSEKHTQTGILSAHRENHLQKATKEAAEGAKKFTEGSGRHGKNTGLFTVDWDLDVKSKLL